MINIRSAMQSATRVSFEKYVIGASPFIILTLESRRASNNKVCKQYRAVRRQSSAFVCRISSRTDRVTIATNTNAMPNENISYTFLNMYHIGLIDHYLLIKLQKNILISK